MIFAGLADVKLREGLLIGEGLTQAWLVCIALAFLCGVFDVSHFIACNVRECMVGEVNEFVCVSSVHGCCQCFFDVLLCCMCAVLFKH